MFISVDLKVDEISGKYQDVKRNCWLGETTKPMTVNNDNNLSPTIQTADCQGLTLPAGPSLFTGFRACVAFILPAWFQAKLALNLTAGPAPP